MLEINFDILILMAINGLAGLEQRNDKNKLPSL